MLSVPAYLARIGYAESTEPTAETLRKIHRAHLLTVPFENLDISFKRYIECDAHASIRKIVEQRRGGFCYELNGAFAWLLVQLGFRVTLLSAQVARDDGSYGPEFDHLTLRVEPAHLPAADSWLADTGFGDSFVEPLPLIPGIEQEQGAEKFRISLQGKDRYQVERRGSAGIWKAQYKFAMLPRKLSDFAAMCHYHQTSPASHFTQKRICSIATPRGRVTMSDLRLIVTQDGRREEQNLTEEEWRPALYKYFGVRL